MKREIEINQDAERYIFPPATIGILGGGQLGRMMALEAREMGYQITTLDPTENSPCGQVADQQITAAFNDIEGARQLAKQSQILTYEFENISSSVAEVLETESYLPQGYSLLYTTQNRVREKKAIESTGVSVAPYREVNNRTEMEEAVDEFGIPCLLKTVEGGYDGKGQCFIKNREDLEDALQLLETNTCILEKFVPFQKEISVVVARSPRGEVKTFPVAENIHREGILHASIVPARIKTEIEENAESIAKVLAEKFQLVGLLAIEMFLLEDGTIYVNELAPRPHNSGHYTQEGCHTSQFEQHIRAVCNLPLGETTLHTPVIMINILGEHLEKVLQKMDSLQSNIKVHLYGKKEAKNKRKMGHLNILANSVEKGIESANLLQIWSDIK